tara:strand:- start:737 stop:1597 length:861 start_codon:yes stop_codon:yes gene_type:complete
MASFSSDNIGYHGPDFIGIGPTKTGSSWLHHQLSLQDNVRIPGKKEIHYLDRIEGLTPHNRALHRRRLLQYLKHQFKADVRPQWMYYASLHKASVNNYEKLFLESFKGVQGEFTPGYIKLSKKIIIELHTRYPKLKYIVGLRSPIDRACSYTRMRYYVALKKGKVHDPKRYLERIQSNVLKEGNTIYNMLPKWLDIIPREQFFFYDFKQISERPEMLIKELGDSLGVTFTNHKALNNVVNEGKELELDKEFQIQLHHKHSLGIQHMIDCDILPDFHYLFKQWLNHG